jgi:hypothetical protein
MIKPHTSLLAIFCFVARDYSGPEIVAKQGPFKL